MVYFLMHEDTKLALFEYENQHVIAVVINGKAKERLPLLEMSSKSMEDSLAEWIMDRGIPATRHGIKSDLRLLNAKSTVDYMISNLGLSLTDHYWICPKDSHYAWKDMNLYENDFAFEYTFDLADSVRHDVLQDSFTPNASLKGDLRKKWVIDENGNRLLIKGNSSTCRQSLCEVLATEIHRRQEKFKYVPYRLIHILSNGNPIIGCECPNFTSMDTEFIPAIDIINSIKKPNESNYYEAYISYCGRHGIEAGYMREFMEYQILTDFIITNTDRHLNNFGVIRDSRTLRLLEPAPIFDSGNSMFYDTGNIKEGYQLLQIKVNSFKQFEVELLKYVKNPGLVDISRLPSENEVYDLFMREKGIREEEAAMLARAYRKKIGFLSELQHGVKIYSYDYLRKNHVSLNKH